MSHANRVLAVSPSSRLGIALLVAVIAIICTPLSFGQVQTGTPPFNSFGGGADTVNLANLNAKWAFPVLNKPGRSGMDFNFDLVYNSAIWYPSGSGTSQKWQFVPNWGWGISTDKGGYSTYTQTVTIYCTDTSFGDALVNMYTNFVYHDGAGVSHYFPGAATSNYHPPTGSC